MPFKSHPSTSCPTCAPLTHRADALDAGQIDGVDPGDDEDEVGLGEGGVLRPRHDAPHHLALDAPQRLCLQRRLLLRYTEKREHTGSQKRN